MRDPRPSWKNTLNTNLTTYGIQDRAQAKAQELCYPFYAWNGQVYPTTDGSGKKHPFVPAPICLTEVLDRGEDRHCARAMCGVQGATWFNSSTQKYYCRTCALLINAQPGQKGLCVQHEMVEQEPRRQCPLCENEFVMLPNGRYPDHGCHITVIIEKPRS